MEREGRGQGLRETRQYNEAGFTGLILASLTLSCLSVHASYRGDYEGARLFSNLAVLSAVGSVAIYALGGSQEQASGVSVRPHAG